MSYGYCVTYNFLKICKKINEPRIPNPLRLNGNTWAKSKQEKVDTCVIFLIRIKLMEKYFSNEIINLPYPYVKHCKRNARGFDLID